MIFSESCEEIITKNLNQIFYIKQTYKNLGQKISIKNFLHKNNPNEIFILLSTQHKTKKYCAKQNDDEKTKIKII